MTKLVRGTIGFAHVMGIRTMPWDLQTAERANIPHKNGREQGQGCFSLEPDSADADDWRIWTLGEPDTGFSPIAQSRLLAASRIV